MPHRKCRILLIQLIIRIMKIRHFAFAALALFAFTAAAAPKTPKKKIASCGGKQNKKSSVSLSNDNDSISYAFGKSSVSLSNDNDTISYALGMSQAPTPEMIKDYLMQAGSDSAYVDAFFKGMKDGINAGDDKKEKAYQMGMQAGMNVKSRLFPQIEQQIYGEDSTKHLSGDMFLAGMLDGKNGVSALFDKGGVTYNTQTVGQFLQSRVDAMTAKANGKLYGPIMKKKNEDFIKQMAKQPGVKALPGGVYYKKLTPGTGATPTRNQIAEVSYEGRLMDGKVFDSTNGNTVEFRVGDLIPGFATALLKMKVGAEWIVYIPWNQAYGDQQQGPIPPYSALTFKVKLVGVKNAPAAPRMNAQP